MLQLGKKLKQGLVLIMATLTLPSAHSMNAVYPIAMPTATSSEYYTKTVNLKETAGSFLAEATMLVYDEILRYQRDVEFTHGLDEGQLAAFDYDAFEANVLWFMDELVGIESEWIKDAENPETGAYGYVQFLDVDSVETAVNRYRYHIEKFNTRRSGFGYTRSQTIDLWFPPIKTDTYDLSIADIPDIKALPSNTITDANLLMNESTLLLTSVKGVETQKYYEYSISTNSDGTLGDASIDMVNQTYGDTGVGDELYSFFMSNVSLEVLGQIQYAFQNEKYDDLEKLGFLYSDLDTDYKTNSSMWEGSEFDDSKVKKVGGYWTYPAYTTEFGLEIPIKTTYTASTKRDWNPRGYSDGSRMEYPEWLITLERKVNSQLIGTVVYPSVYEHKADLALLTYDEMVALAFVNLHREESKDYNFVQLAKGDVAAAKEIYSKNHHTNPDAKTLARMELFFQIH